MRASNHPLRLVSLFLGVAIALCVSFGCGPPTATNDPGEPATGTAPELTDDVIRTRINDARVFDVPEENGNGEPISWSFDEDEPKVIQIVDKQVDGDHATVVLDIKTSSSPRRRNLRELWGQLTTHWRLQRGWVMRRWEITHTENISMKYRNLPPRQPGDQPPPNR
ncbi:MAG TPA: hypothetical protein VEV84_01325 [Pyrinomonadaceae bacterium]|jgi:hypothetical protein|nr:hypothetical protein [Pyrinomonadaceae bacterium]